MHYYVIKCLVGSSYLTRDPDGLYKWCSVLPGGPRPPVNAKRFYTRPEAEGVIEFLCIKDFTEVISMEDAALCPV